MSEAGTAKKRHRWVGAAIVVGALVVIVGGCSVYYATKGSTYDVDNAREAIAQCESRIAEQLKAPSTAEFDSTATGGGTWTVEGTVDAENSFGAAIRSEYQCTVVVNGENLTTTIDFIR